MKKNTQPLSKHILIVDGYNVINAWDELKKLSAAENLEAARDELNSMISEYASFAGVNAQIVYDAYLVKDKARIYKTYKNLEIIFTAEDETADSYIEKLITRLGKKRFLEFTVATDDIPVQQIILGSGGSRISTMQLGALLKINRSKIQKTIKNNNISTGYNIMDVLDEKSGQKLEKLRKNQK